MCDQDLPKKTVSETFHRKSWSKTTEEEENEPQKEKKKTKVALMPHDVGHLRGLKNDGLVLEERK